MATFPNGLNLTRPDFGGVDQNVDIHMEEHIGIVDSTFAYTSHLAKELAGSTHQTNSTNQLRFERLSSAKVMGRQAGEDLVAQQTKQSPAYIVVDRLSYVRHVFDLQDIWTQNRDYRTSIAKNHGTLLAQAFDKNAMIAAMKAPEFVPPPEVADAIKPGSLVTTTLDGTERTSAAAATIIAAHSQLVEQMTRDGKSDALFTEGVTYVSPRVFAILRESDKLMNVQYSQGSGNNYAQGRVALLNGIRVEELGVMPDTAITDNPLGPAFNITAAEAQRQMVLFIPSLSHIVAQVRGLEAGIWDDKTRMATYLQTDHLYNIGLRRPDCVGVVSFKTA